MSADPEALARDAISQSIAAHEAMLGRRCIAAIVEAADVIARALERGGKVLLFGNGGSASDAAHFAAELVGRFQRDRRPLAAVCLSCNQPALTAIANDFGFEQVFARQIEALGASGDVAVAISTSGRSANVLAGMRAAHDLELPTIAMTGEEPGPLADAHVRVRVPATTTARVQECHILAAHVMCELVERRVG